MAKPPLLRSSVIKPGYRYFTLMLFGTNPIERIFQEKSMMPALPKYLALDSWIIDGNYSRTLERRISACDTVFLFDLPVEVCLEGAVSRLGKGRYDMPWIDAKLDPKFEQEIMEFPVKNLSYVYSLIDKYKDGKTVVIFKSREEADEFVRRSIHLLDYNMSPYCIQNDIE